MSKNIVTINCDKSLQDDLESTSIKSKGLFIDWIPTSSNDAKKAENIIIQTEAIETSIKKNIKTILFDRYQSITNKETQWFQKHKNIVLCEPSIITRTGFTYLPFWVKIKSLNEINLNNETRDITFLHYGKISSKIKSLEKYYKSYKTLFGDATLAYNSESENQIDIAEKNLDYMERTNKNYKDAQYTIALGSERDYKTGYLDPFIFKALENNCVPFIPDEHRFYHALPIIKPNTIEWYNKQYDLCYIGLICYFYQCIEKYYPEMIIQNVIKQIDKLLEQ